MQDDVVVEAAGEAKEGTEIWNKQLVDNHNLVTEAAIQK